MVKKERKVNLSQSRHITSPDLLVPFGIFISIWFMCFNSMLLQFLKRLVFIVRICLKVELEMPCFITTRGLAEV